MSKYENWDLVLVSHNSGRVLEREWADAPAELRARVICVENGTDEASLEVARRLFSTVHRVANEGLSVANNFGMKQGTAPFVLFVNPDIRCDPASLLAFEAWLDAHGGLVGPRLVNGDGSQQDSCRSWPSLMSQVLNRLLPADHVLNRRYLWPSTANSFVPWLLGASIAVKRSDINGVGGWPEDYFLYFEDTELAWSFWNAGLPVAILEGERWHHAWEKGSRSLLSVTARHHMRSALRFYKRHPKLIVGWRDRAVRKSVELGC